MLHYQMQLRWMALLLIAAITSFHCSPATSSDNNTAEDFNTFYKKFYADTVFQQSRLVFPLEGHYAGNANPEESQEDFAWTKDNWVGLETVTDQDTVYKKKITKTDSTMVEEIYIPDSGFFMKRHFALKEHKWYLVYYLVSDM